MPHKHRSARSGHSSRSRRAGAHSPISIPRTPMFPTPVVIKTVGLKTDRILSVSTLTSDVFVCLW